MASDTRQPLDEGDPRQAGPYRLEARLGEGSTGPVYLGRSESARGRGAGAHAVAVKVIHPRLAGDQGFLRQFAGELAEADRTKTTATGAGVLETVAADAAADPPWLASPYVPGASLAEAVRTHGPLPAGTVRVLGAGLAKALAALHGAGMPHTALQPHKVLLAADGPRLTPFAAARAATAADPSHTVSAVDGRFLAPEQARGRHAGAESDVFALAGLLVLAATGRPPFQDGPGAEALRSIVEDPPELDDVPEPLPALLAAALAKAPERRPSLEYVLRQLSPDAEELAAWLPAPLAEQAAVPAGPRRLGRRNLLFAAGGAAALAAAGTGAALLLTGSDGAGASGSEGEGGGDRAAPPEAGLKPAHTLSLGKVRYTSRIAYSSGGEWLAVTLEDRVTLWDAQSRRRITDLAERDIASTSAVAYGDGLLALGYIHAPDLNDLASDVGGITVWDTRGDRPKRVVRLESPSEGKPLQAMAAVAFSPDGRLVVGARNAKDAVGKVQVWDVRSGKKKAELLIGEGKGNRTSAARSLAFSPDGKLLAAGWGSQLEGGVALFTTDDWKPAGELPLRRTDAFGVTSLAFTPDGRTLAGTFGGLAVWDVPERKLTARIGKADDGHQNLALSPDGRTVALSRGAEGVTLYDVRTQKRQVTVRAGRGGAGDLAFRPNGRTLAGVVTTTKMLTAVQLWTVE